MVVALKYDYYCVNFIGRLMLGMVMLVTMGEKGEPMGKPDFCFIGDVLKIKIGFWWTDPKSSLELVPRNFYNEWKLKLQCLWFLKTLEVWNIAILNCMILFNFNSF